MFVASKILWLLISPSNALVFLAIFGVLLTMTHFARAGRRLALVCLIALVAAGLSPLPNWLLLPLENRFPVWRQGDGPAPTGMIILGGAVDTNVSPNRNAGLELNEAGDRILAMIALARQYPDARIIFNGGAGSLLGERSTEADEVRRLIANYGLSPDRIQFDNRSRTTYENALEARKFVTSGQSGRWLLVTSAWHMPRSMAVFRAAGVTVEAYPVDFRTPATGAASEGSSEISRGLRRFDVVMREWVGLAGYRLTGATQELLPAP